MEAFKDSKAESSAGSGWAKRCFLSGLVTLAVAAVIALISGCSVYKSNGRKTFEDRSSGNVHVSNAATAANADEKNRDTCWTQPIREPLWDLPQDSELRVHAISSDLLEVCLVTED